VEIVNAFIALELVASVWMITVEVLKTPSLHLRRRGHRR
jgi:hypothetical protein